MSVSRPYKPLVVLSCALSVSLTGQTLQANEPPVEPGFNSTPPLKINKSSEIAAQKATISTRATATSEWAVTLEPGQRIDDIAVQYGASSYKPIGSLENTFLLTIPSSASKALATRDMLRSEPGIKNAVQQRRRERVKRVTITDPLFNAQWHLDKTNATNFTDYDGVSPGVDANVVNAWNIQNVDGSGVTIGIVDDGLERTHPDLSQNYNANASYDYNTPNSDPAPNSVNDSHGTSVAGVAAADNDGTKCGVGVAYNTTLAGLQLIAGPINDAQEAAALSYTEAGVSQKNTIDVFNNSWGPGDFGEYSDFAPDAQNFYFTEIGVSYPNAVDGAGPLVQAALQDGVTNGRGGKGVIYVWAAGNGRTSPDNVNYDNYANSRYTIAIGAVRGGGDASPSVPGQYAAYSEPGAAMLVAAPSSTFPGQGIRTTDLLGANGGNNGSDTSGSADCRDDFGGTSSAAPLASGVIALMLDANPNLGWRDVQHILVETAVKNDPTNSDWTMNGAGHDINHNYGFGMIDANAAVAAAKTWTNVPTATSITSSVVTSASPSNAIPDNNSTGITSTINITEDIQLEHVDVMVNVTHPFRGNVQIELISPEGTSSILADVRLDPYDNIADPEFRNDTNKGWRFMTVRNWGEMSAGTWTLKVRDLENSNAQGYIGTYSQTGTFNSWQLVLHGKDQKAVKRDFNNDGISDILLQANDGLISIWLMNSNGTRNSTSTVGYPPAGATIQGVGDFNYDGTVDILLQRPDGLIFIWIIENAVRTSSSSLGYPPTGSAIPGIGDFNNDGTDDILLRRADGLAFIWLINNGARSSFSSLGYPPSTATIKGIGDFNNDGTEDIVFRRSDGLGFIWLINDGVRSSFTSLGFPPATASIAGVGDFNGNGSDDLFFQRNDGLTFIWMIDNGVRTSYTAPGFVSTTSSVEAVGSHNGDSTDDVLFFRDDGLTYIWMMENGLRTTTTYPGYR